MGINLLNDTTGMDAKFNCDQLPYRIIAVDIGITAGLEL
jgi:hypothetical protein